MITTVVKNISRYLALFGLDPLKTIRSLRGIPAYLSDYVELTRQRPSKNGRFEFGSFYPCLEDRFATSGLAKGHYFHQDLLVAGRIFAAQPKRHIDVASRIDGFVAHVASFRKIFVIDIRPLKSNMRNVEFLQADLMGKLPKELAESCDSISCLHALEHFGLGRYGDPVRWDGYLLGLENLVAILEPGGKLYLSVPIGPQRIEFNAHRVFAVAYLLELFAGGLHLDNFSFVDDRGDLHENVALNQSDIDANYGCSYGCGIFELTKTGQSGHRQAEMAPQ